MMLKNIQDYHGVRKPLCFNRFHAKHGETSFMAYMNTEGLDKHVHPDNFISFSDISTVPIDFLRELNIFGKLFTIFTRETAFVIYDWFSYI